MEKRLSIIFGTRPEYLKIKSLVDNLKNTSSIKFYLIQVFQHEELVIDEKDENFYIGVQLNTIKLNNRLTELAVNIPLALEDILKKSNTVLIQGDTATAFFSALSAFHKKIHIIHLEAGLRTYDLQNPFPEEAYRSMLSRITNVHLCPDINSENNLRNENISSNIHVVGNTILDLVNSYNLTSTIRNKVIITIHRRENWDKIESVLESVINLARIYKELEFFWILHSNPSIREIVKNVIIDLPNIRIVSQKTHRELADYLAECYCVITDSGGIQEEAAFLGKTCFVFRNKTERVSIPYPYIIMCPTVEILEHTFKNTNIILLPSCKVYGDGYSSDKIIKIMENSLTV
jgi:UDP-N-acetylglucosamine 2-epimerase (non-hydrolysing)